MRIAHIDTERTWRGGQQQVFSLIKGLEARGHQNFAVVHAKGELAKRLDASIPLHRVRPWGEWDFVAAHFVNRWLKNNAIDVVHAHSGHGVALASFSALGTELPVVITRRVDFHLKKNMFSKWKYDRVSQFVAISEGVKRVLLEDGISSEKITVVPSGVDFHKYQDVKAVSKQQLDMPSNAVIVGQVAALAPHKDQNNFLEALALLRKFHADVYGVLVGEGEMRSQLEQTVSRLGLRPFVRFTGFQQRPLDYLAAFDVFCLSSREEGLGTSIIDAMALRVPVVATEAGGIPDLIEPGVTGYLAPSSNPTALAQVLQRCLQEKGQNAAMLSQAHNKAEKFDVNNTISQMEMVYLKLSTVLST